MKRSLSGRSYLNKGGNTINAATGGRGGALPKGNHVVDNTSWDYHQGIATCGAPISSIQPDQKGHEEREVDLMKTLSLSPSDRPQC